mmetsp:Transcript_4575/g.11087  ORF Transcript_4575/g.11087 Transcript_4575/m.11087 type:complete len:238 (+) Transcript_4575:996-1709(+)
MQRRAVSTPLHFMLKWNSISGNSSCAWITMCRASAARSTQTEPSVLGIREVPLVVCRREPSNLTPQPGAGRRIPSCSRACCPRWLITIPNARELPCSSSDGSPRRSYTWTRYPDFASCIATAVPAGPAPTTTTLSPCGASESVPRPGDPRIASGLVGPLSTLLQECRTRGQMHGRKKTQDLRVAQLVWRPVSENLALSFEVLKERLNGTPSTVSSTLREQQRIFFINTQEPIPDQLY